MCFFIFFHLFFPFLSTDQMTRGLIPKVPGVFQFEDFLYTFCIVSKSDIDSQRPMFPETFYHKQDIRRTKSRWFCMVLSCAQVEKNRWLDQAAGRDPCHSRAHWERGMTSVQCTRLLWFMFNQSKCTYLTAGYMSIIHIRIYVYIYIVYNYIYIYINNILLSYACTVCVNTHTCMYIIYGTDITDSFSVSAGTAAAVPYCPAVRT